METADHQHSRLRYYAQQTYWPAPIRAFRPPKGKLTQKEGWARFYQQQKIIDQVLHLRCRLDDIWDRRKT